MGGALCDVGLFGPIIASPKGHFSKTDEKGVYQQNRPLPAGQLSPNLPFNFLGMHSIFSLRFHILEKRRTVFLQPTALN